MEFLQWVILIEGILTLLVSAALVLLGFRNRIVWLAVAIMGGFGVLTFLSLARQLGGFSVGPLDQQDFSYLVYGIVLGAELAFVCLYPSFRPVRWRGILFGLAAFPLLVGLLIVASKVAGAEGLRQSAVQALIVVREFLPPVGVAILAISYFRARRQTERNQLLYALLPFLVWSLNHATLGLLHTNLPGVSFRPWVFASGIAFAAAVLGCIAGAVFEWTQRPQYRRQSLILIGWALFILPLTFLQFLDANLHLLVDGFTVVLLFYAVARFQIVKIDFSIPSRTRHALRGAFALPLFFIAQQAIEAMAFDRGLSIGVATVVTGLAVFFLQMVQNRVTRATTDHSPNDLRGYEHFRRLEIYRTALDGVYQDGKVDPAESRTLLGLREKLRISLAEHSALERDIRSARAAVA